ncbi:MAG: archease [Thiohalobacteraceae bacterium]
MMPNPNTESLATLRGSLSAMPRWEHLIRRHEIGLRCYGHTRDETFAQAALAWTALIVEPGRVQPQSAIDLECRSSASSMLLIDWLQLLKTEILVRNRLFCAFDVHITGQHLHAMAWGESLDVARHSPAADLHTVRVEAARLVSSGGAGWTAECVVHL